MGDEYHGKMQSIRDAIETAGGANSRNGRRQLEFVRVSEDTQAAEDVAIRPAPILEQVFSDFRHSIIQKQSRLLWGRETGVLVLTHLLPGLTRVWLLPTIQSKVD